MALKLGEVAFMHQRTQERPVLLLDDVLSELDNSRRHHLLEVITHPEQQSILTATGITDFDAQFLAHAHLMRVDQGSVFDLSA
jgi:DNA replication and repair protein RecF